EQLAARRPKFLQLRRRFRLQVTTDQRLRAAGPEGNPLAVRQQKFVAVGRDELLDFERPDGIEAGGQLAQQRFPFLRRYWQVQPVGVELAGPLFEFLQDLTQRFPFGCDQFGHEQAGEDAVLFRHVTLDTQSAGFLASNNDRFAFHQRADVFETDWRLIDLHAEQLGDGVDLMTGGHGANHRARPAAVFLQVVEGERQYLVRRQPRAALIDDAEAVRTPVEAEAELGLAGANQRARFAHALGVRFR